ncbi:hypothetical protein OB955_09895 [Halobacteria archaeon AArc-m2/3/4]|uniref:Uncharacterized protein n=1 Tax=Natronoglomus mannanivorans TaxID=2979990 RepID=A0AAP2YUR5_9EURY|nr:hypothetical protein [Halobacteria archaeon AArc-xg1-1]MCU4973054.1 hypothetical protein [Halobacteria archaeon AArc-m2/3/4]
MSDIALIGAFLPVEPTVAITAVVVLAGLAFIAFMIFLAFGLPVPSKQSTTADGSADSPSALDAQETD